ncbi:hypothetical protein PSSHI_23310 [Photobacterium sp. R1]
MPKDNRTRRVRIARLNATRGGKTEMEDWEKSTRFMISTTTDLGWRSTAEHGFTVMGSKIGRRVSPLRTPQ